MRINVSFPAVVRHVPSRGRRERLAFVAETVPVDLPSLSPSEMVPAGKPIRERSGREAELAVHGGVAWKRLRDARGAPVGPGAFADYLTGEGEDPGRGGSFHNRFSRTPILAVATPGHASLGRLIDEFSRGAVPDPALLVPRRIVFDERGGPGAERVSAYLADEVRTAGDAVYLRWRPGAAPPTEYGKSAVWIDDRPHLGTHGHVPVNPWRAGEACAAWDVIPDGLDDLREALSAFPSGADDVDDLLRLANWAAGRIPAQVLADPGMFRNASEWRRREPALREAVAVLERYEAPAAVGAIGLAEAPAVLRAAADALDLHLATLRPQEHVTGRAPGLVRYIREVGLRRLDERLDRAMDVSDAEALAAAAP